MKWVRKFWFIIQTQKTKYIFWSDGPTGPSDASIIPNPDAIYIDWKFSNLLNSLLFYNSEPLLVLRYYFRVMCLLISLISIPSRWQISSYLTHVVVGLTSSYQVLKLTLPMVTFQEIEFSTGRDLRSLK